MQKWLLVFLLLPLLATAQLKEFEVSEMERPDVAVVQANGQWPDDALLLVYSSLDGLQFRSSMGAVDKQTYNNTAGRYEILVKPVKQMMFVAKPGFMELKIATINPNPKDVFYYKVEEKQQEVVNTKPGTLKIVTEPSGADVFVNGMRMADKTPFEGEPNPGSTRIKLQKAKHETIDTTVAVRSGEPTVLNLQMKPTTLWVNISSMPSGASVTLDGTPRGTTPASFELDLTDKTKRGSKQLKLSLADHETISTTIDLQPSATPLEKDYSLKKEKGSFSITSTPEGAQVFIGGQYKGTTPLQGSMEVGQYEVEVKLDGYTAPKQNLTVSENGSNEVNFTMREPSALPTAIGQAYGGGIVFQLRKDGHGLIVALDDLGQLKWKEAKAKCKAYDGGGYTDWYLPSITALKNLYKVVDEVNGSLVKEGDRAISKGYYWSSTVFFPTASWSIDFRDGRASDSYMKYTEYVRPVRAF